MPVANTVPLKAVCALEEVADSCVTDLRAKATQRSVAPALLANATRAVLGTVRRSAVLNTRHSVRSVPGRSVVVYEVARGFSDGQEFATSINVANEGSVTGVTELGVQPAIIRSSPFTEAPSPPPQTP